MRKLLSLCLTLTLLASLAAAPAQADETIASSNISIGSDSEPLAENIALATSALDGAYVAYGETFSFNDIVGPRDKASGYQAAVNGRGVKVTGGGVSQVASALYLALRQLDGIEYVEKKTYGSKYNQSYVDSGDDAIVTDYSAGTDFRFKNGYGDFVINIWSDDYEISCLLLASDGIGNYSDPAEGPSDDGTATIYLDGDDALIGNITRAAQAIDGIVLESGDTFSFNNIVGPRTGENGYESAVNGRGVKVTGGGVAQVASALWLAIKDRGDVTVTEKSTYGSRYNQSYVASADDAIVTDYSAGTDFRFRYDGPGEFVIRMDVRDGQVLVCDAAVD
jgi:vancomycin resistance protein YoaR